MATRQRKGSASGQKLFKVSLWQPMHDGSCTGALSPRLGDRDSCIILVDMLRFLKIQSKAFNHLSDDTPATAPTFQENLKPRHVSARRFHCRSQPSPGRWQEGPGQPKGRSGRRAAGPWVIEMCGIYGVDVTTARKNFPERLRRRIRTIRQMTQFQIECSRLQESHDVRNIKPQYSNLGLRWIAPTGPRPR
jgi:hypothetical protein